MVAVTLPLLSSSPDKPDIYWQITKAPYLEKPQPQLDYSLPQSNIYFKLQEKPYQEFLALQILDIYTTHRAINIKGYALEANPFLPKQPSLELLLVLKGTVSYFVIRDASPQQLKYANDFYRVILLNNLYVMHKGGDL
jgi:hypothetical protein